MSPARHVANASAIFLAGIADGLARSLERAIEECLAALIMWLVNLIGVPS